MRVRERLRLLAAAPALCAFAAAGCKTAEPFDYTLFHQHRPRSILVLPPLDDTMEVEASYAYLATVTSPLAERGYYVFPVALVANMMRENGLPGPAEMHTVSLSKLDEIFGADAVLYLTLSDWGTSYAVLDSSTRVTVAGRLVDVKSGAELWSGQATASQSSSSGSNSIGGMLASALVSQIVSSAVDPSEGVARQANGALFYTKGRGLPPGPYHPDFGRE